MKNNPYNELSDESFLVYLAQNDYMVDGGFLPEGKRLLDMAERIKKSTQVFNEALARLELADEEIDELAAEEMENEVQAEIKDLKNRIAELEAQVDEYIRDKTSHGGAWADWCQENDDAE